MKRSIDIILAGSFLFYFLTFLLPSTLVVPSTTHYNNFSRVDVIEAPTLTIFKSSATISAKNGKEMFMNRFLHDHGSDCAAKVNLHNIFVQLSKTAPSHAQELFKYCFMYMELQNEKTTITRFKDDYTFILDEELLSAEKNYVVFDERNTLVHGSLLVVSAHQKTILREMIDFIIETKDRLLYEPSIVARKLFNSIQLQHSEGIEWQILKLVCDLNEEGVKYGCQAQLDGRSVLLSPHQYLPSQPVLGIDMAKLLPLSSTVSDRPFITTITSRFTNTNRKPLSTPNFFHIISEKECLPTTPICEACMNDIRGGDCTNCQKFCGCFCDSLCKIPVEDKVLTKVFEYAPPIHKRHMDGSAQSGRLIPKIVHQTWFESITKDKYRLVESWKQTNWEYRFYNDAQAADFISTHFPIEVREAYDALLPGAFKADLFRYCVLFISGGVYADVDVLLESRLDEAIDDDVGFIVPLDSPGKESGHQICLWNGLLGSAPGHPFLAAVIETIVNNVRNRFTSVDVMHSMCPGEIDFQLFYRYDILFTTGPCILGASINKFLGRHPQTSFHTNATVVSAKIPGRVVLLEGNKHDMGCYRFTIDEKNLIIAATDMPDFDDRIMHGHDKKNHYSKLKKHGRIYGMSGLYVDNNPSNEEVKFVST